MTTAATWDVDLIYACSYAMGKEFYDMGVHVAIAMVTGRLEVTNLLSTI